MEKNNLGNYGANLTDVRLFVAYFEDLARVSNKSINKLIKEACLPSNYVSNCKRLLQGKQQRKKTITLNLLIHVAKVHKYPFDLSKYIHLLDAPEEDLPKPVN
jgi:hypothetical protein